MSGTGSEAYGVVVAKNVMIPMRDGVRLATDIYHPAEDGKALPGPFPTLLGRTSYDKTSDWLWVEPVADYFTPRGYVVAIQDMRGRYRSEGTGQYFHTANPTDGPDGYDTVEWIAGQDWSNGRVGTVGTSHGAIVQHTVALYRPPHLSAMWPDVGPTNIYAHMSREGGAMALQMFGALFLHAHDSQEISDDPAAQWQVINAMEHLREWVFRTPFKPGHTPLSVVPNLERTLFDYYHRGTYDEFWSQDCCDQERYFDRHADIPATFSGGWFDPFSAATTNYYASMAKQNTSSQRLIMGPWTHGGMREGVSYAANVDFGQDSVWGNERYNAERLRWFDRWLKDSPNAVENDPPVLLFVMGGGDGRRTPGGKLSHGGRWRQEHEWPLARTQFTNFYLHSGGELSTELPGASAEPARYSYDPAHPVPTIGGNVASFYEIVPVAAGLDEAYLKYVPARVRMRNIVPQGPMHQKEEPGIVAAREPYPPLAARPDVLVFQTPVLAEPLEVTGPIAVNLWVSSSTVDTDFTAKLVDVYPVNEDYRAGYHLILVDSIIRTRYREGWDREVMMTPGGVYQVTIQLPPTSNLFQAGHRLRIDISSSNFPRFDLNPNTGEPMGRHTHQLVALNTVFLDADRPSHVILPIIPQQGRA